MLAENMKALVEYVETLRRKKGVSAYIPHFDLKDGGYETRALFLLEAPGLKAIKTDFISGNIYDFLL